MKKIIEKLMIRAKVYATDWEVDSRLVGFGVTRGELIDIVHRVVGARLDAVPDDPLGTAGQFAHIFGTRHLRGLMKAKGWDTHREENIEAVIEPASGRRLVYQSVDEACSSRSPKAISEKGPGSQRLIDRAQPQLFKHLPEAVRKSQRPANADLWYFCVSVTGDDVCAELSRPVPLEGGNFGGFYERIFIIRQGEWLDLRVKDVPMDDLTDIEPTLSRK